DLDEAQAAFGLAVADGAGAEPFNLARALEPRASIWEIFPRTQAALIVALLLAAGLALGHRLDGLQAARRAVRAEDARHKWAAKQSIDALQKQRAELVQQVDAMRAFLATRVVWSSCARDLAGRVAPEIKLMAFQGRNDLEFFGPKRDPNFKVNKSLTLRLTSPIPKTGTIPKQVDRFVEILRHEAALRHELPVIELSNLAWRQEAGKAPEALCVISCRPKGDVAAKPAKPAAASKDQPAKK
ncbi:MAG TPA: hypothetical protein VG406_15110, partial [Isosphaeraceae bacterium]|nr:hypothetical protein [Isosphaeraceae bacterium]